MAYGVLKEYDGQDSSPFFGIEKVAVLQEARAFNDPQLDTRRCLQIITKLLYLLNQGETFTKIEAAAVFFPVTKLFQFRDTHLRRMVYLIIKELSRFVDEAIIVTNSLIKDINSYTDTCRANAIRLLCQITDGTLPTQTEVYLKQAILDKNPTVSIAALVSGIHMQQKNPGIGNRWIEEVDIAVQSQAELVQFHALTLLFQIKQNNLLAVGKLLCRFTFELVDFYRKDYFGEVRKIGVSKLRKLLASWDAEVIHSPLALCLLARYTTQVTKKLRDTSQPYGTFYRYLQSCLYHESEMVALEGFRAISQFRNVTTSELTPAITVIQHFFSSTKPVLRFAAVRTLNKVAMAHPVAVTNSNISMESLILAQNSSEAILAITTILKTGNESSVDHLMKLIRVFMSGIADECKIVVVEAITSFCLKFPLKHRSVLNLLCNIFEEEGGFEYNRAIIDSIVLLIRDIPDAKECGLQILCEFIDNREFTYLSVQVLHFLGKEGPKTSDPSKYIRCIYNQILLENATVRASAVSVLAKFGVMVDSLRPRILVLLRRCLFDDDDEVRDRATLYLNALGDGSIALTDKDAKEFLFGSLDVTLTNMEASLKNYLQHPAKEPFRINNVTNEVKSQPHAKKKAPSKQPSYLGAPLSVADAIEKLLFSIPEFASFGKLFKSSAPVELTEVGTEYAVNVVKHIFYGHVVFQFNCTNTTREQLLENVTVIVDASGAEEFSEVGTKPMGCLPYNMPGQTFVAFEKPEGLLSVGKFSNLLRFTVKEVDRSTGEAEADGLEDEYQLNHFNVTVADYILKVAVSNIERAWIRINPHSECIKTYDVGHRESMAEVVNELINLLSMQPCEGTEVVPSNSRSHTCLLSGLCMGSLKVLARSSFSIDGAKKVALSLAVRSEDENVCNAIHDLVAYRFHC